MKQTKSQSLLAATAALSLTVALSGSVSAEPKENQAIQSRLEQYESRFNESDPEAVAALFAVDVLYYGPLGRIFEGREAVEERYRRNLAAGFSNMEVETLEIRVFGDTAYDIARYTITSPKGEPLTGYHLAILEKVDGEWIVQRTLVNAVMPEPPAE